MSTNPFTKEEQYLHQMHPRLKFTAGGYDRLKNADRQEEAKARC